MKTLSLVANTPEWISTRARYDCASEAASARGSDKRLNRTELLRVKSTGDTREFSQWVQEKLLDRGHAVEVYGLEFAETLLADSLYPVIAVDDSDQFLASFDGITMDEQSGAEVKLWNEELVAGVRRGEIPDTHWPQIAHQFIVGDALKEIIFVVTDGTPARTVYLRCSRSDFTARIADVRAAWKQFNEDLKTFKHVEVMPPAVAAPVMALPALSIQVNGAISLIDNLALFGEKLQAFIGNVNKEPKDDQGFADLEAAVKVLRTAQEALEAAERNALAQTASIDEMRRTVGLYKDMARSNRLLFDKIVEERKKTLRFEIMQEGVMAFAAHFEGLNKRLGGRHMPPIAVDFAAVMKGKKTLASLREAVSNELARGKIAANAVADNIQINLNTLRDLAVGYAFLFADVGAIVLKAPEDLTTLVKLRIAEHQAAEAKKEADLREKLRTEEVAKLERAQREKEAAEQAEKQRAEQRQIQEIRMQEVVPPAGVAAEMRQRSAPPILQPAAWGLPPKRPTDDQIIEALALHFRVHESKVIEWLLAIDLNAATERMCAEFK